MLGIKEVEEVWKTVREAVEEQAKKADSLRSIAKEIFEKGEVTEANAKEILDTYSTSVDYL